MENAPQDIAAPDATNSAVPGTTGEMPQAPTAADIFSGLDDDTRAYVENKGWAGAPDIVNSYKNLEKMVGGKISIPGQDDAEGWNDLYNRLGRPEAPDQYELEAPDGSDAEVMDWFKNAVHQSGLNQAQAGQIFQSYNEMVQARAQAQQAQAEADNEAQLNELKKEWGSAYDQQIAKAQQAAQVFGVEAEMVDKMASAIGLKATLSHFAKIGESISEDKFVDGKGGTGHAGNIGLTPAQAQAQINDLLADQSFLTRYQRGDKDAVNRISNLYAMAS